MPEGAHLARGGRFGPPLSRKLGDQVHQNECRSLQLRHMPLSVFDTKGIPGHRRERIEAGPLQERQPLTLQPQLFSAPTVSSLRRLLPPFRQDSASAWISRRALVQTSSWIPPIVFAALRLSERAQPHSSYGASVLALAARLRSQRDQRRA